MANTTCKNCGVAITWADVAGKWVPLVDGVRHRCEAWKPEQATVHEPRFASYTQMASNVMDKSGSVHTSITQAPSRTTTGGPYDAPVKRTELQELRHAVQRLSRACELLYEAVDAMAQRELAK